MALPAVPTTATLQRVAPIASNSLLLTAVNLGLVRGKPGLKEVLSTAPVPWLTARLANYLGVSPLLFERVVAHRQPLPRQLAARMAEAAGLQPGDIEAVVEITTSDEPPAYRPAPADRAWGDVLEFAPLARTVEVFVTS